MRFCAFLVFTAAAMHASPAGSILGVIRDPQGAAVAGAGIKAVHGQLSLRRFAISDASGAFEIAGAPPGTWSLEVEAHGFKRSNVAPVIVQVDQSTRTEIVLELGDLSETIEIKADLPLVETARSTLTAVIGRAAINSLPLDGRQYLDLAMVTPGVIPAAPGTQGNGFNVSGIRSQSNIYMLDGVSNMDPQTNQPLNMFRITDAVEEFAVQTGVPQAEFGRGAGGQVNVVTRSGSNQLHGSAFEYVRNTILTASDFFTNKLAGPKNALKRNQFGGTAGGPVRRNRTFFFVSYEGFRQVAPQVSSVLVPSLAQRATVTDLIAQRLLAFYPLPNAAGSLNYISNVRQLDSDDTALLRIDHQLTQRDQISARWTQYWGSSTAPGPTPLSGGNQGPLSQFSAMLSEDHRFSPNSANELRLGFSRYSVARSPQDSGFDTAGIFAGIQTPIDSGLPSIAIGGGIAALGTNANFPQGRTSSTTEAFDNFTLSAPFGATHHTWRFGAHLRREDLARYLDRSERGTVMFANFGDFAKGMIMSATLRTGSTQAYWRRYPWDAYWQNEFRARPNLSIYVGARYEYPSAIEELRGHATNFVPGYGPMLAGTNRVLDINPTLTGPASIIYRDAPFRLPSAGVYPDRNNLTPMLGFAWSPGAVVIRGGTRIAYDDLFNNVPSSMALAAPFNLQTTQTANLTQPGKFAWPLAFNQNVPLVSNYNQQGPGTPTVGILTFQGVDPHLRSAYAYLYDLAVERSIGHLFGFEVAYQGSSAHDLGIFIDQNQPTVIVGNSTVRGPLAPNQQFFPYNHFGQSQIAKSIGNSNYNALVVTARRQYSRGFLWQASYSLGKSLDYNSSYYGSGMSTGEPGAPIDARNLAIEHGPSAFDVRRRFVGLFALDVPAGPLPRVVAGWRVAGIVILQSGSPFTVGYGGPDTSGFNQQTQGISPDGGNRPNLVKPGPLPQNNRNPDVAFDTSWFAPNLAGQDGTSGRNAYRGPALSNTNFSVSKSFPLGDAVRLQFRTDFFNLFNHSNFANPIADLNNANFGHITQTLGSAVSTSVATSGGATGGPRVIQLALRLQF